MRFGTRFHALLDPTSNFAAKHQKGPDADRRTKIWAAAEAEATAAGIELIPGDEWEMLHAMEASVRANPIAMSLLEGAEHEIGFRMDAPQGPFQVQCRADLLHRFSHVVDIKTTADVDAFNVSVSTYGYHRQAALYRWIVSHACGGELPDWSFLVVEKSYPQFRCRVLDLNDEYLAIGWREVSSALDEIGRRTAEKDWSDHRDAEVLVPPTWMATVNRVADVA